jgi:hypothetical protein
MATVLHRLPLYGLLLSIEEIVAGKRPKRFEGGEEAGEVDTRQETGAS